jgi:hypothetical protein
MTPPILQGRVSWRGGTASAEGYAPDHSNMTALQPAMERGVNLWYSEYPAVNAALVGHDERRKGNWCEREGI